MQNLNGGNGGNSGATFTPTLTWPEVKLSNNVSTPNTVLDFSAGQVIVVDGSNNRLSVPFTAMSKSIASTWAAGTGNGGLDTGTVAANTSYHCHAICQAAGANPDFLFSLSATSPTLPSGYTFSRLLGGFLTNNSAQIPGFIQRGQYFWYKTQIKDLTRVAIPETATAYTLSVPSGYPVLAIGIISSGATYTEFAIAVWSPLINAVNPTADPLDGNFLGSTGARGNAANAGLLEILTENGQVYMKRSAGSVYLDSGATPSWQTWGYRYL
jgi:hypothetical protein